MRALTEGRLYGIIDLGYAQAEDSWRIASQLIDGGVDIIQLRAKDRATRDLRSLAARLQELCAAHEVPFVINDYVTLATETGADALHLGQDDPSVAEARREFAGLIGKSTHSLDQAIAARDEGADYIGFGPLFATPTKPDYKPIGLTDVARVHGLVDLPIFCIGGIKLENMASVIAAGARRVVIVSGLLQADDSTDYARRCKALLSSIEHQTSNIKHS